MNLLRWIKPAAASGSAPNNGGVSLSRRQMAFLAGLLIVFSLVLSMLLTSKGFHSVPAYQPGDIARADIIIPQDTFIEDEAATQLRRTEAKANALPVYRFNPSVQEDRASRLKAAFSRSRTLLGLDPSGEKPSGGSRRTPFRSLAPAVKEELRSISQDLGVKPPVDDLLAFLVNDGFSSILENRLITMAREVYSAAPIPDETLPKVQKESIHKMNAATVKAETIPVSLIPTLARVRERLGGQISQDARLAAAARPHVIRIMDGLIVPNLTFDASLTKSREEEDVKNVDHVLRKLKKGKVVLRQGDEVGADHLIQIEAIRKLTLTDSSMRPTAGMAFLIGILLTILVFVVRFIPSRQWNDLKLLTFLMLSLAANVLLLKLSWFVCESVSQSFLASPFNDKHFFFYLLPFAYGSMLVTLLAGETCAAIFTAFFCVFAVQATGTDAHGLFYILITNLAGILFTRQATQRIGIIGAGFKLGLSAAALSFVLQMIGQAPMDWINGVFGASLAFLSGLFNAVFLLFTLPLCERLFMVTTEIRLSELGNLNLPVIRELILKAPGTYNHSIAVGTLCEGAAKVIGINPLFLRIASLYHDIGKSAQPQYFVENQQEGNPHDGIPPLESVRILKEHVAYGISLARRVPLPSSIVDMIPQHHGTKLMKFFHEKAKKEAATAGGEIREDEYRYAGPKPQTKAAAVLMLADGIEAASRTLKDHSQARLLDLIRKIIEDTADDGQFSECDITLSEMNLITQSFLETLSSYHHNRIAYPGVDFNQPLGTSASGAYGRRDA